MDKENYLPKVRNQYEDLPYPERNPADERVRLNGVTVDCLDRINHYCHAGMKDFSKGSRILVAGGGTGDSTIFFAEQLRCSDSEIVYLDFSKASMAVAKERAEIRGLKNIRWINGSILDIRDMNLGRFDHISCTGVLHHLEDPEQGLGALKSVLESEGAMSLMLYAKYGRTAIYHIQELMKIINQNQSNAEECIANCRTTLDLLPPDHWFNLAGLNKNISDVELYDLYLHSQDRCYDVPGLYEFTESAGLEIVHLFDDYGVRGNALYEPEEYIRDRELLGTVKNLEKKHQQAVSELVNGRIKLHSFYVSGKCIKKPDYTMQDFIPSLPLTILSGSYVALYNLVDSSDGNVSINLSSNDSGNIKIKFRKTGNIAKFFKYLDGRCTLGEILSRILSSGNHVNDRKGYENLIDEFSGLFLALANHNLLLLRHRSVPRYKTLDELHSQMNQ